ncbi:putative vitellogenin receptor [Leguminivora glycinivorella]|uniref:putative vitellogenin receptor n=1 Tax=Leguminivora glycinivorella TaxID=1035111 RepID=UPI00200C5B69|nr:putative vitellogenin receptor [Leguminivora glycinivorella]
MFYIFIISCLLIACSAEFSDEHHVYEKECLGEDKFTCLDGGCISHDQYCNNKTDCADGSDENFCPDHPPDEQLCNTTHQFMCHDGQTCIPSEWVCDSQPDCIDASDEVNCTALAAIANATCKGFKCGDDTCISSLWMCDGHYDCEDRSDEDIEKTCRHSLNSHLLDTGPSCLEFSPMDTRQYKCLDESFCLTPGRMCDNITDCRDGSDEGPFCAKWHTMCVNSTCPAFNTTCSPDRDGRQCLCNPSPSAHRYNETTKTCEDIDECLSELPQCSHYCTNFQGHFRCSCEHGYVSDVFRYLCFAEGPEAMLFYSTEKDIRYIKVKTKQEVIVATGIKKSHGVSYDGKYLYWVETAEGHQAIVRAQLENVAETKQILVSLGLYDAGDIAVDWSGNIYFTDTSRGAIYVCTGDGSVCARIYTEALRPKFVTLDVKKGQMYWADVASLQGGHVIMRARMDGSDPEVMTASLNNFAKGLALDAPNQRLYFVDNTIMVLMTDTKQLYPLFKLRVHHPYSLAVFENTVYWSDWTSNTIQTIDKIHLEQKKSYLIKLQAPVYGMHIFHPVLLLGRESNPCAHHTCSHLCLLTSNATYSCGCPAGMKLNGTVCYNEPNYRPQYLIVGAGSSFTRFRYDTLGNPEAHAATFDIGRVQSMAYDNRRDILYIYDGMRKCIVKIEMADFTLGVTHVFAFSGLENVVDMDYDHVTDNLYVLDSGRRFLEVFSLKDGKRALLHRFPDQEIPVSFCILQHFGRLLVAVVESEQNNELHIDSIGLDGDEREHQHVLLNNLKGPRVRLRSLHDSDMVAISDEGSNTIEFLHLRTLPRDFKQDLRKRIPTPASSLAVTMPYIFWSDGRTSRVFWDEYMLATTTPRRVELSIFPNASHLHLQATFTPGSTPPVPHPCTNNPCSHICVQTPTLPILGTFPAIEKPTSYKCLCPPGLLVEGGNCTKLAECKGDEAYCYKSNECIPVIKRCDGERDCKDGEDEEDCSPSTPGPRKCLPNQIECNGGCIAYDEICPQESTATFTPPFYCEFDQFQCRNSKICLEREQVCDKHQDCPDGSDEGPLCHTLRCLDTEFMCTSGNCILGGWRCDGDADCTDGSDEVDCANRTCNVGSYQCRSGQCVEIQRRCDGQNDCFDGSDEERCQEPIDTVPSCPEGEIPCELNKTICFPQTAWCNSKDDCPGGTDEHNCSACVPRGFYECTQERRCLSMTNVCDHNRDCKDGSDETPDACELVNRTSRVFSVPYPPAVCNHGFLCRTGQCIEFEGVCDQTPDCFDGSDENGQCFTACENTTCSDGCQATPVGPHCTCKHGYELRPDKHTCGDIDECPEDMCAHHCQNTPGSFLCSCRHGYTLRSDRRSCKANIRAIKSVLFTTLYSVRSVSDLGVIHVEFSDKRLGNLSDVDIDYSKRRFYVTAPDAGRLIEVASNAENSTASNYYKNRALIPQNDTTITYVTNIGRPTKMTVDWVTGNVYFVDAKSTEPCIRACNFDKKRCARIKTLPAGGTFPSLVVSPENRKLYYSVNYMNTSNVSSVDLDGLNEKRTSFYGTTIGLAVDGPLLYMATRFGMYVIDPGRSYKTKDFRGWSDQNPTIIYVFEDYLYVLNNRRIFRCLNYGAKICLSFISQMPETQSFVLWHPSIQRLLKNDCQDFLCENLCVLSENGPKCLCEDGTVAKDGKCTLLEKDLVPLFNGVPAQSFIQESYQLSITVITITLSLFAMYLGIYCYYIRVVRKGPDTLPVRFQNQPSVSGSESQAPTIDMPTASGSRHEFVNPLQFVRDAWQRSFRSNRPIGTAGLTIEVPTPDENLSDTESDQDLKDERNLIK